MSGSAAVAEAVSRLFDEATPEEATSLAGLTQALSRLRCRPIELFDVDYLDPGVCGRWEGLADIDRLLLRQGLPSRSFTWAHELGHLALDHVGQPVADHASEAVTLCNPLLVKYMLEEADGQAPSRAVMHTLNRGVVDGAIDIKQEAEAEAFAGLLIRRLRQASRSATPHVQARLNDTLG